ncbi:HNH endonuclease [Hyalangium versicolor]|uniref:HNH endonuclease n=1 Tax=Hyalangium versicolor TaxID=2861190 RepID=UPI001CC976B2|nr:hypothetical protein [Hyalangium versicolor]
MRDSELKERFLRVAPDIGAAAQVFDATAKAGRLYTLEEHKDVAGQVTAREMSDLYKRRMARSGSAGRRVYDALMLRAKGICPLCGHLPVSTLDHQLPQAMFPALAVTPTNLVPACGDCNKWKQDAIPRKAEEQTFHPYFDDFGKEPWLHAEVVENTPPTLRYSVRPPASWPAIWGARARHHFRTYKLGRLYKTQAANELMNMQHLLLGLQEKAGVDGVRSHLRSHEESCAKANPNSWQTAMYRALGESEWFCTEGLVQLRSLAV